MTAEKGPPEHTSPSLIERGRLLLVKLPGVQSRSAVRRLRIKPGWRLRGQSQATRTRRNRTRLWTGHSRTLYVILLLAGLALLFSGRLVPYRAGAPVSQAASTSQMFSAPRSSSSATSAETDEVSPANTGTGVNLQKSGAGTASTGAARAATHSANTPPALPSCASGLGPVTIDPCKWFMQAVLGAIGWITGTTDATLDAAIGPLTQSVVMFGTPHVLTDQNPSVVALQFLLELVALGALVFIVVVAGFNLMLRPHLGVEYHEVRYILPRVCLGGVGIVAATWLCGELIDFSNLLSSAAVTNSFLPVSMPDLTTLGNGNSPALGELMLAFAVLGYTIFALLVIIQIIVRLATLDLLLVLAPLAMACWILPQTQRWAERWAMLFVGYLLAQPLQLICISLGLSIATSMDTQPGLANLFGNLSIEVTQAALCVGTYYVAFKIPKYLTNFASGGTTLSTIATGLLIAGGLARATDALSEGGAALLSGGAAVAGAAAGVATGGASTAVSAVAAAAAPVAQAGMGMGGNGGAGFGGGPSPGSPGAAGVGGVGSRSTMSSASGGMAHTDTGLVPGFADAGPLVVSGSQPGSSPAALQAPSQDSSDPSQQPDLSQLSESSPLPASPEAEQARHERQARAWSSIDDTLQTLREKPAVPPDAVSGAGPSDTPVFDQSLNTQVEGDRESDGGLL